MARTRKPTEYEMKCTAKALLQNEIKNQELFLDAAEKKVESLRAELVALTSANVKKKSVRRINKELEEQREAITSIKNWLIKHKAGKAV